MPKTLTYKGKTRTLGEWSKITGINTTTIASRLSAGWPVEKILSPGKHYAGCGLVIGKTDLRFLYEVEKLSTCQISQRTKIPPSTIRNLIIKYGLRLRSRRDGILLRVDAISAGNKGKKVVMTPQWRKHISESRIALNIGRGWRITGNGYREITKGENAGKGEHVIVIEKLIGRRLKKGEVVHHLNLNRLDNRIENLMLMKGSEHTSLHRRIKHFKKQIKSNAITQ